MKVVHENESAEKAIDLYSLSNQLDLSFSNFTHYNENNSELSKKIVKLF